MNQPVSHAHAVTAASILALITERRIGEAQAGIGQVASGDAQHDLAWLELANALHVLGRTDQAFAAYTHLQRVSPRCALAFHEMGIRLMNGGRLEEALDYLLRGNEIDDTNHLVYTNLGIIYRYLGQAELAHASFRRVLELKPDYEDGKYNLGMHLLTEGDFDAFALYEWRLKKAVPGAPERAGGVLLLPSLYDKDRWDGGDCRGKHILVWAEQGMGDNLMMLRYLPLLRGRGARVTVVCIPALAQVMGTHADHVLIDPEEPLHYAFDYYCPSMSLPFLFGTRLDTVPNTVPYLAASPAARQAWAGCLDGLAGLKVGLVWAGGKLFKRDALRSLVLSQLAPLMEVEGVHWISLQKGQAAEDLADVDWRILDWAYHCEDLMDTAALIEQLDLVITVDTSVAHLAGALGKPVWMMSRFEGEWRWIRGRSDSPWYPTMRIFQQPKIGDWDSVLAAIVHALRPLAAQSGLTAPLSQQQWAACARACAAGPVRASKPGFLARWFGRGR